MKIGQMVALLAITTERDRQDEKWGVQTHSPAEWMMILMEEVGEFAEAEMEARYRDGAKARIREELVQVAAVALAMLEDCDRNDWSS